MSRVPSAQVGNARQGPFCGSTGDCTTATDSIVRFTMQCLAVARQQAAAGRRKRQLSDAEKGIAGELIYNGVPYVTTDIS